MDAKPSPISNESLERMAERVAKALRLVRKRAPADVKRRARDVLARVFDTVHAPEGDENDSVRVRRQLARDLEHLNGELRGRQTFVPHFYSHGKLAIIRGFEPVRIRETIDPRKVDAHFVRYESRAWRAEARLRWFLLRAGITPEKPPEKPAWLQPYAEFEEYHELLWGRLKRGAPDPRKPGA